MKLSERILRLCGWTISNKVSLPKKCVICIAPHTSNWDFFWGNLFNMSMGAKSHFFIKKEWFVFPFNLIMKPLGGIPINRSQKMRMTDQMAAEFDKHEEFQVAVSPEGTRKYNPEWKKGFYFIAVKANVPILLAYFDYKTKEMGYGKIIVPTGDVDQDMQLIKDYYKGIHGKKPEKFGY